MGEEVYIYTSSVGVPMLYKTKIVGNTITADINWDTAAEESVQTRAEGEYQTVPQGFYTLGSWNVKGALIIWIVKGVNRIDFFILSDD